MRSVKGFTLIELLITILILSIACASVGLAFKSGTDIWKRGKAFLSSGLFPVLDLTELEDDLRRSVPLSDARMSASSNRLVFFVAEKDSVFQYVYDYDLLSKKLIKNVFRLKGLEVGDQVSSEVISGDLSSCSFNYCLYDSDTEKMITVDTFDEKDLFPFLISIEFKCEKKKQNKLIYLPQYKIAAKTFIEDKKTGLG